MKSEIRDVNQEWLLLQSLETMSRVSKGFRQEQVIAHRPQLGNHYVIMT